MKALGLGMIVIALLAVSALLDPDSGVAIWRSLRADLDDSTRRVERLALENALLAREIEVLEREPDALDRAIREELDLARPGEVVIRFVPARAEAEAPRPAPSQP